MNAAVFLDHLFALRFKWMHLLICDKCFIVSKEKYKNVGKRSFLSLTLNLMALRSIFSLFSSNWMATIKFCHNWFAVSNWWWKSLFEVRATEIVSNSVNKVKTKKIVQHNSALTIGNCSIVSKEMHQKTYFDFLFFRSISNKSSTSESIKRMSLD